MTINQPNLEQATRPALGDPARTPKQNQFAGFMPPVSNTTYTPNQFFDVCLPHCSRSAIRVVGYFIRRTLGWCDQFGRPREELIEISFRELSTRAGVSRDRLRPALDEAIAGHFIECVRDGQPHATRDPGHRARYRLRWSDLETYEKDPARFSGFFEREGNRTDIPNQYFDHILPNEPLSIIKVVGAIIRSSIGFAARRGSRRQSASLSYSQIQNFTRLRSRKELASALHASLARQYIVRLQRGQFSAERAEQRSAVYALRWADGWMVDRNDPKSLPEDLVEHQSGIPTRGGPVSPPEERSEIPTTSKTKIKNETEKQQPVEVSPAFELLREEGFTLAVASSLAARIPLESIQNQINWLPSRNPSRSRLGMLRRALEENWPEPAPVRISGLLHPHEGREFVRQFYAGFHRHTGEPINEPGVRECELALKFIERIRAFGEEPSRLPQWGRGLGVWASQQPNALPSFTVAANQLGDRLLADAEQELSRRKARAQEAHKAKWQDSYQEFLRRKDKEMSDVHPESWQQFESERESTRARLQAHASGWASSLLATHETEENRLQALQEHFDLPDFWQWDAKHNLYPFNQPQ